jgi:hypothetical protein
MTDSPVLEYCLALGTSEVYAEDECARLRDGRVKTYEEITWPLSVNGRKLIEQETVSYVT